jgi:hypothetical protein
MLRYREAMAEKRLIQRFYQDFGGVIAQAAAAAASAQQPADPMGGAADAAPKP